MHEDEKRLATIIIDGENTETFISISGKEISSSSYNITLYFLVEYSDKNYDNYKVLKNISLKKYDLSNINASLIFEIILEKAVDGSGFNSFANVHLPNYVNYSDDKFLMENKRKIKVLTHKEFNESYENVKSSNQKENMKLLANLFETANNLEPATEFVNEFKQYLNKQNLYYDIYDVDGYLSILTDDNGFEFYFDFGDMSKTFKPKNLNVFGVFISHYHRDHYNLLLENNINAKYYVLPYRGCVLYNNKQLYPQDEIRILLKYNDRIQLIFAADQNHIKHQRNVLYSYKINDKTAFYFPMYRSPNNPNLESICVSFNNGKIFYPGDTSHYMYKPYIQNIKHLIASHHGGKVGILNFNGAQIDEIIVNTYSKNFNTNPYNENIKKYTNNCNNLFIGKNNDGLVFKRIPL